MTKLEAVSVINSVYASSRLFRKFQTDNFPMALIGIAETSTPTTGSFPGSKPIERRLVISIQIGVEEAVDDAEDILDEACVAVEKALCVPDIGIKGVQDWSYDGTTRVIGQPSASGLLLTQTLTYSCTIRTLDSAPDKNLSA
ncbi:hypothetical protein [Pararhizobium sp.]|uniref:hypothetical protein n=1 Tax=Pararhizobium sp. TaxID=1977563 RepID=UPI003D1457C4